MTEVQEFRSLTIGATAEEAAEGFRRLGRAINLCDELHPEIAVAFNAYERAASQPWPFRWFALRRWHSRLTDFASVAGPL